jgi:hypothetical protein
VEDTFNPYVEWFGIARASGRPNHYALLGLAPFESDPAMIVAAVEKRMAVLAGIEPGTHEPLRQRLTAEVTRAAKTLTDAARKKQYDELLRQNASPRSAGQTRPAAHAKPQTIQSRDRLASDELLPPRANSAGPPLPAAPDAGDPMAPVMPTGAAGDPMAPLPVSPGEPTPAADNSVGDISDQLASARQAARKLAVRRQKAPYLVLASALVLIVVVGVALAVAYANGLIHIGRLPAVAERDSVEPDELIVPPIETTNDDTTIERTKSDARPLATANDTAPPAVETPASESSKASDNTTTRPADPPVDPEQSARLTAELAAARKALGERNTQAASARIAAAEKLAASREQRELVAGFQTLPKYVDGFWEAVREGLKGLEEAGELQVGNTFVSIVEVGSNRLTIRANGQNRRYPLDELPAGLAVAIAKRWFDDRPENKLCLGAFYFVDPRTDVAEAKRYWEEAASAGIDVKGLLALLPIAGK